MVDPKVLAALDRLVGSFVGPDALPAGGAAAVASIAMGTALGAKVARMSSSRSKDTEATSAELESLTKRITPEFVKDCSAFEELLRAFKTPKEHPERVNRVRDGWLSATRASAEVARLADEADRLLASLSESVKSDLRGDLQAAHILVQAGRRIAASNANENAQHLDSSLAKSVLRHL